MKYEGPNKEGFRRDVEIFLEWRDEFPNARPRSWESIQLAAWDLADAYGIGRSEIWDILPEYEKED